MALQAAGRVPAMLNFTAGPHNLVAACQTARAALVLTSRSFVEKADLAKVVEAICAGGAHRLARGRARERFTRRTSSARRSRPAARSPSGSPTIRRSSSSPPAPRASPKGVVLSHANLLANVAQIDALFDMRLTDVFFNPLPIFHAFGLTGGLLLGLVTSMKVYLYPTPLHYRQIPELIDKAGATVLIGTDTFLAGLRAQRRRLRASARCATSSPAPSP